MLSVERGERAEEQEGNWIMISWETCIFDVVWLVRLLYLCYSVHRLGLAADGLVLTWWPLITFYYTDRCPLRIWDGPPFLDWAAAAPLGKVLTARISATNKLLLPLYRIYIYSWYEILDWWLIWILFHKLAISKWQQRRLGGPAPLDVLAGNREGFESISSRRRPPTLFSLSLSLYLIQIIDERRCTRERDRGSPANCSRSRLMRHSSTSTFIRIHFEQPDLHSLLSLSQQETCFVSHSLSPRSFLSPAVSLFSSTQLCVHQQLESNASACVFNAHLSRRDSSFWPR